MILNGYELYINLLRFQNDCGAAGNELSDSTCPKAPTDDDALVPLF
jgi:hypothetical protein